MKLFHENPIFETVKSKVIISLFETVRLSVSISLRNLYNSLKSIKEKVLISKIPWKQGLHQRNEIANSVLLRLFMTRNEMRNTGCLQYSKGGKTLPSA